MAFGRSPHGERGLKSEDMFGIGGAAGSRSPHGERGLKYILWVDHRKYYRSLSSWRAWIEIYPVCYGILRVTSSLSSWRAWIEIVLDGRRLLRVCGRSPHGERGLK